MLSHPLEGAQVGVESFLKDGVVSRGDVLVFFLSYESCKGLIDGAKIVIPKRSISRAEAALSYGSDLHISYRSGNIYIC